MSARVVRGLALGSLLLATGVLVGWWGRATGSPRSEAASLRPAAIEDARRRTEAVNHISVQAVDTSGIQEAVRKAVGEELARARDEADLADEAELTAAEPNPDTLLKVDAGHQYIEAAIRSGRWEAKDAEHIRTLGHELSGEQYQELIRPLVIAINAGTIRPNLEGLPF